MSLLMKVSLLRVLIKIILDALWLEKEPIWSEIPLIEQDRRAECFVFLSFY